MDQIQVLTAHPWWRFIWPVLAGGAVFLGAAVLRPLIFSRLTRLTEKTTWTWDNILLSSLKRPYLLWCLIGGLYTALVLSPAQAGVVALGSRVLSILWLVSLTLVVLHLADEVIRAHGAQLASALPLTSLTQNLAKGAILVLGGLMILNGLGISITPILTALGVGGLAVALALQDTLSNLFSGVYVTLARQIRVGDYIKLDSGEEGYVADITWRSTRIRNLPNHWIVIPNTKLASAIVTNYDLPTQDMAVLVQVGVDYRMDLEKVERVTCEVGKQVMKEVAGGIPEFDPFIRFHTFADSSINFTVILRGKTFVDQYLVKHEFVKRLQKRYAQEGITIPFPLRTVIMEPPVPAPKG
jgi:small-conductance mechanosensitive channel